MGALSRRHQPLLYSRGSDTVAARIRGIEGFYDEKVEKVGYGAYNGKAMHGTRERVLQNVVERHAVRVEDLAAELGITPAAVRRHLDNLRADGLVEIRAV